ncbi:stressosome-associated protein Prli42 [Niallia sp. Krafla_26]
MSKKRKKTQKIVVYLMIFAMLASTILTGILMFI